MKNNNLPKYIPKNIRNSIEDFVEIVNNLLGNRIKQIYLYGSYARGDFREDSDIDIMILTDLSDEEILESRDKIYELAYDIEEKYDFEIYLSPLIKNIDKFNYWSEALPFYTNVQKEGITLNE